MHSLRWADVSLFLQHILQRFPTQAACPTIFGHLRASEEHEGEPIMIQLSLRKGVTNTPGDLSDAGVDYFMVYHSEAQVN
ncbi:hypothetical protein GGR55DRAFT_646039 [Xylaria sp. FL0064]|nr:hypothetical protein GGR55DRAFT_646039 [Xylaria sp. FL0064]